MPVFSAVPQLPPGLSPRRGVDLLADHLCRIQEELEYRLAHLDSGNISEIDVEQTPLLTRDAQGRQVNVLTDLRGSVSALEQTAEGFSSTVAAYGQTLEGYGAQVSQFQQTAGSLSASVADLASGQSSMLRLDANGVYITDGAGGRVTISGGQIDADSLDLTGSIGWSELKNSVEDYIDEGYLMAEDAQAAAADAADTVEGWRYGSTTYIDGSMLMTGTVMASELLGGTVGLLDSRERQVGYIDITNTSGGYGIEIGSDTGGIRICADGNFWVDAAYGSVGVTGSGFVSDADVVPEASDTYDLGARGLYWGDIYCTNDAIITSDREKKKDIGYGLEGYGALFDALRPVSYRLKNGTSGRVHMGMVAQDVEAALAGCGLTDMEFAGLIRSETEEGVEYALRYGEFIPLLIDQVHKLKARVAALEG